MQQCDLVHPFARASARACSRAHAAVHARASTRARPRPCQRVYARVLPCARVWASIRASSHPSTGVSAPRLLVLTNRAGLSMRTGTLLNSGEKRPWSGARRCKVATGARAAGYLVLVRWYGWQTLHCPGMAWTV
eukprot:888304-Alexandrium_andersonii.AAC.1